jgi:hypothetical protein
VTLGGTISDSATLSGGGIGGAAPTGTITFALYAPNDPTCSSPAIFTATAPVNGNGTYSSAPFTSSAIGTYHWIANYGGDLNNTPTANICNAANEFVVVIAGPLTGSNPIPTLSESAMVLLVALLAIVGFAAMRRQAR